MISLDTVFGEPVSRVQTVVGGIREPSVGSYRSRRGVVVGSSGGRRISGSELNVVVAAPESALTDELGLAQSLRPGDERVEASTNHQVRTRRHDRDLGWRTGGARAVELADAIFDYLELLDNRRMRIQPNDSTEP